MPAITNAASSNLVEQAQCICNAKCILDREKGDSVAFGHVRIFDNVLVTYSLQMLLALDSQNVA